jgi:hypothetical protein
VFLKNDLMIDEINDFIDEERGYPYGRPTSGRYVIIEANGNLAYCLSVISYMMNNGNSYCENFNFDTGISSFTFTTSDNNKGIYFSFDCD